MATGKVAIVTAAGRGMGAAIARELAAQGWSLALLSPSGAAERLAGELGGFGLTGGDGAGYITGQNLRVDGGLTRGV